MMNRSFRGINNIKNGTFPSLSIVSSIVYTTLMDLVNPGFEIFLAENLPFYSEGTPGAPGVSSSHPGSRPIMADFREFGSFRLDRSLRSGRRAPGHLSTGYPQDINSGSLGSLSSPNLWVNSLFLVLQIDYPRNLIQLFRVRPQLF